MLFPHRRTHWVSPDFGNWLLAHRSTDIFSLLRDLSCHFSWVWGGAASPLLYPFGQEFVWRISQKSFPFIHLLKKISCFHHWLSLVFFCFIFYWFLLLFLSFPLFFFGFTLLSLFYFLKWKLNSSNWELSSFPIQEFSAIKTSLQLHPTNFGRFSFSFSSKCFFPNILK